MKKFIMTSPYQGRLSKGIYHAADNELLRYDKETAFPIIPVINAYAGAGEEIEIIMNLADYENAHTNLALFEEELWELSAEKGFTYKKIEPVLLPYNNLIDTHIDLFGALTDRISDGDTLFCCITYGSKPVPIVESMALNYALMAKKNVSVECVVYGAMDHEAKTMSIYDITSLIYISETIRAMAENNVADPAKKLRELLG
ncbi:MAG: hypothetical protein IJ874_07085 [Ruminococcus sp.]|nr:hypothetical protein [Ruminococcus sp.]